MKIAPDLEMCVNCKHGRRSFKKGRLPDLDPDNKHCKDLPFAFMPRINEYDAECTMFEERTDD